MRSDRLAGYRSQHPGGARPASQTWRSGRTIAVGQLYYMTPQAGPLKQDRQQPYWGQIMTPRSGKRAPHCTIWCADNSSYGGAFDWARFSDWLRAVRPYRRRCVFVAAPDVVANAVATLGLFRW